VTELKQVNNVLNLSRELNFKDCLKKPYYKIASIILAQKDIFSYDDIEKQVKEHKIKYKNVDGYTNLIKHALKKLNNVLLIYQVSSSFYIVNRD